LPFCNEYYERHSKDGSQKEWMNDWIIFVREWCCISTYHSTNY
jgi:hypothetical protein